MKILIISHTYAPALNGQAVFTTNLAEGLVENKHSVRVMVPAIDRPAFETRNGVEIQAISALDLRFIHKDLSLAFGSYKKIDQVISDFQPELIHLQDPSPVSRVALEIGKKRQIPVLATHHPGPAIWAPYLPGENFIVQKIIVPVVWKVFIQYLNRTDWVSAPSRAAAKMLVKHGLKNDVSPISCGVRLENFHLQVASRQVLRNKFNLPLDKKLFVFVGRLDEEKKVDLLIKAMIFINDPEVMLVLAGNGLKNNKLHELANANGLAGRIIFLGYVQRSEIADLLGACDIFVMPGDVESLSISTLEAMACGKPIIAAKAMALPELVQDGCNGFLFQPGDAQDLADKINTIAGECDRWEEMSAYSQNLVLDHRLPNTISAYEKLYLKLSRTKKIQKPVWRAFPIPAWLSNGQLLFSIVQWAALVVILLISLITRYQPVSAEPVEPIIQISPEMLSAIKQFLNAIKQFDLAGQQANGFQLIFQTLLRIFDIL